MSGDVLDHDSDRPQRRGWLVLGVVAALVLAGVAITRLADTGGQPAADSSTPPPTVVTQGPTAAVVGWQPIDAARDAVRGTDLVFAGATGVQVVDVGGTFGEITAYADRWTAPDGAAVTVVSTEPGYLTGPAPGAAEPGPVFAADGRRTTAGETLGLLPGAEPGRAWIIVPAGAEGQCSVARIDAAGARTGETIGYGCGFVPLRETVAGLVGRTGSALDRSSGTLVAPDGAVVEIGGSVLAVSRTQVVTWSRRVGDPLQVIDLVSGDAQAVALESGRIPRRVALSDDGRRLAVVLAEQLISVRAYEVWAYDLTTLDADVALLTTLADDPLLVAWAGDVLVVAADGVDVFDASTHGRYRTGVEPLPRREAMVATR